MLDITGSPSHRSPPSARRPVRAQVPWPRSWDSSEEEGAWLECSQTQLVQAARCTACILQERGENGRDWIGLQESGSNSRKRCRLIGAGPDQTGKAGKNASDFSIIQLPLSFSPGNATSPKEGGTPHEIPREGGGEGQFWQTLPREQQNCILKYKGVQFRAWWIWVPIRVQLLRKAILASPRTFLLLSGNNTKRGVVGRMTPDVDKACQLNRNDK